MKQMKLLVASLVAAGSLASVQAFAADEHHKNVGPSSVCVVQIANVLHNAPQVQAATDGLKKQFDADQKKIEADQKAVQDKITDLKKNEAVLSQKDKDAAQAEITKARQELVGNMGSFQQKLGDAQNKVMKQVFDSLNGVIQDIAKTQHCDVVLDSQFVVYATPSHDLTADVQKAFNDKK
jgi:Skp family chaperone for outer membrane proteins